VLLTSLAATNTEWLVSFIFWLGWSVDNHTSWQDGPQGAHHHPSGTASSWSSWTNVSLHHNWWRWAPWGLSSQLVQLSSLQPSRKIKETSHTVFVAASQVNSAIALYCAFNSPAKHLQPEERHTINRHKGDCQRNQIV